MERRDLSPYQLWLICIATGLTYFACGVFTLELTKGTGGIAFIWPASGVAVAAMSVIWPAFRYRLALCIGVASCAANLLEGTPLLGSVGFTVANVAECLIASHYILRGTAGLPAFDSRLGLIAFGKGTLIAGLTSATIATSTVVGSAELVPFFAAWFSTVVLGILIVTPLLVELFVPFVFPAKRRTGSRSVAYAVVIALAAIAGFAAFAQTAFPLLFLALATVILASFAAGVGGAVRAVFIIAIMGSVMTSHQLGPINSIGADIQGRVIYLQFFLLTLLACGLPTAALLSESRRSAALLAEQNRLLAMAERTAKVGHWQLEIGAEEVFWSQEVFRIHGLEVTDAMVPLENAITAYHEDDRPIVEKAIEQSLATRDPYFFQARLVLPDGTMRRVECHGIVEVQDDEPVAMFGTIVDVTEKAEAIDQLEAVRRSAERQAEHALKLAETDQLTGIANRRKLIARLDEQVGEARAMKAPLSFVMFDVDNFKSINDTYGHPEGDAVLVRIAQIAASCLRKGDLVGRLGGEEFGVILPGTDLEIASNVAERIRSQIAAKAGRGRPTGPISVSLGVAELKEGGTAETLLGAADLALYEAKASGKNCYRLAA
ncbi:diguanylate cyclase [Erythrobacter sp. 3-20A1M]|uniref:sensor domain-containing diguanylate cyclase n=1 Tax=Erythrobacter sp. 3-20A1M TaxID=2653850 RepID=UPI001BFC2AA0|nr:diguanylate cyclase [Erythrobacter sp. 3-20A1M]QWC55860.1 diguanylate cyclase [Erythrobacter sp. 3-20A1M]